MINRPAAAAVYLEVGSRAAADLTTYSDIDLVAEAAERLNFADLKRAYKSATDIATVDDVKVDVESLAA